MQKSIGAIIVAVILLGGYMFFKGDDKKMMEETPEITTEETMEEDLSLVSTGVSVMENEAVGEYFATKDGMALYTFTKDDFNVSNCKGECLKKWPVFFSKELLIEDGFGMITRESGVVQSTYLEKPLYTFFKDEKSGEINGHKVKDVWHLATFSK